MGNPVQVEYMHLCDYAFTGESGKPGIIGIFDRLNAQSLPVQHPLMCLAIKLHGQPGHVVPIRIAIEAQGGTKLVDIPEQPLTIGPDAGAFLKVELAGVVFTSAGRHSVSLISQGVVLASLTLTVQRMAQKVA